VFQLGLNLSVTVNQNGNLNCVKAYQGYATTGAQTVSLVQTGNNNVACIFQ